MSPKVLVLLASYNGASWIAEQLDSILHQDDVDIQLVIRDDASSDDTLAQIRRSATRSNIRFSAAPHSGGSAAQNFFNLIRENPVDGYDFVALADQDDIWEPGKLSRACSALIRGDAAGYSCAVRAFWPDGREVLLQQTESLTESDFLFEGAGQGCTFVLSASFYQTVSTLLCSASVEIERIHYHDWFIYAVSRCRRLPWIFDPEPMVRYRQHGSNDTGARASFGDLLKRLELIRNNWYGLQLRAIAACCLRAAPENAIVVEWNRLLDMQPGWSRRFRIAKFCLRGGRRRQMDRYVLVVSTIIGWV